ncbi:MAG: beta-phosphoglucomutase [Clostridiaceae bacterium]|nr:beta-phosphoglucomutase [Clostridiaceae bacterium]
MKFDAVIFDLDGVLVHTDKFHYLAWKSIADDLGVYFDETINTRLRGVGRMDSLNILLECCDRPLSDAEKEGLAAVKNERYRRYLSLMTPADVTDEVRTGLSRIRAAGIKTAIGSVSKNAGYILEKTDLVKYIDAVSDGNNIVNSKPDPEVFLKAAGFLGIAPSRAAVVEDAVAGIEAAVRGGFFAIAVGDARNHPKADFKAQSFTEIINLALY